MDQKSSKIASKFFSSDSPFSKEFEICTRSGLEYTVWMCKDQDVDYDSENFRARRVSNTRFQGPTELLPPSSALNGAVITQLSNGIAIPDADQFKVLDNTYEVVDNAGCTSFLVAIIDNKTKDSSKSVNRPFFANQPRRRTDREPVRRKRSRHER